MTVMGSCLVRGGLGFCLLAVGGICGKGFLTLSSTAGSSNGLARTGRGYELMGSPCCTCLEVEQASWAVALLAQDSGRC